MTAPPPANLAAMQKLRLIQSGVGGHGGSWTQATTDHPAAEVVAHVDPNPDALAKARETQDVPQFADLQEALTNVEADAVLSVTPPRLHREQAEVAFGAGKHLLIEKPLAGTLDDARAMVAAAESVDRTLMVTQQRRWAPGPVAVKRLLDEGGTGAVSHGHIAFYIPSDFRGSFRESMPHVTLVDMVVHHLDLLRHFTGRDVEAVYAIDWDPAHTLYEPGTNAALMMILDLTGGVRFTFAGDWCAAGRPTSWHGDWRVQCARGCVELAGLADERVTVATCGTWGADVELTDVPLPTATNPQAEALSHFAGCVAEGREPLTSGRDNLKTLAAVMAAVESCETGRKVQVSDL